MRPTRRITRHNLNTRRPVYGRPRHTERQYRINSVSTRNVVTRELIERYGLENIQREMIKEITQKLIESGMIVFKTQEGVVPDTQEITAEINIVKNG
jgi:hypothetical protein